LPLDPRFAGPNVAKNDGLLRAIKIRSTISFRGDVKPSLSCCKILQHVKDLMRYDRDTQRQNSVAISRPVSSEFLFGVSAATRATLVNGSGMIRTQMGSTIHQKMVPVAWDDLHDPPP
jgi:hypothetical protein